MQTIEKNVRRKGKTVGKNFTGRINHRYNLEFLISTPVRGTQGTYIALREAINNAFDARASRIRIWFGVHGSSGKEALFIADDGVGFNRSGVDSAMSWAYSSRKRDDSTTIGTNGTGIKSFLGLGELEKTNLHILTMNAEFQGCVSMNINFDYLLGLCQKKVKADDYVSMTNVPNDWNQNLNRKTGSTVILTGFDKRKIRKPEQIIDELSEYLTPKACHLVEVFDGDSWKTLTPFEFGGTNYEFSYKSKTLGNVDFDVYYGGNAECPTVCGPINAILPLLNDVSGRMTKTQKDKMGKVWKTVGGHIYIENANMFRMHDGTFSEEFYSGKACDEFVELLGLVNEELMKLVEKAKFEDLKKRKGQLVDRIIAASQRINPASIFKDGEAEPVLEKVIRSTKDIDFTPKKIFMRPNSTEEIILKNQGNKEITLSDVKWEVKGSLSPFHIIEQKGIRVKIRAGKTEGIGVLIARGSFGSHEINVKVDEKAFISPYISGPSYIKAGDTYEYKIKRSDDPNVRFEAIGLEVIDDASILPNIDDKKSIFIKLGNNAKEGNFLLLAKNAKGKEIAKRKKVTITEDIIGKPPEPTIVFNGQEYYLTVGFEYKNTIAQIDFDLAENDLPIIVVNTIHERIRDLTVWASTDHILSAVSFVAAIDQVSKGLLRSKDASRVSEEFFAKIKAEMFDK